MRRGIRAQINKPQGNKIMSGKARDKSVANGFTPEQHLAVAARMDKTWKHARLTESRDDANDDLNVKSIKRFKAPIALDGNPAVAYITAKESFEHGHRVYSLELQEIKNAPWSEGNTPSSCMGERAPPHGQPPANADGNHLLPKVSPESAERSSDLRKSAGTEPAAGIWGMRLWEGAAGSGAGDACPAHMLKNFPCHVMLTA